ncbi:MAG: polyphosphate kinase 2 family protein [Taibaiella sp.]|nr:polyphosphate kinase 2 family protein [Taibaiella sp.]
MNISKLLVPTGKKISLKKFSTYPQKEHDKDELLKQLADCVEQLADLQYRLYAEDRQSLLIVLQGMDSSGKDGTIKEIMKGVNPQGVKVHSFKHPSGQELDHDFLWRHYQVLPAHGEITIFNRSHYENVLISKVHPELVVAEKLPGIFAPEDIGKKFWKARYERINDFEETITSNGTRIVKFFLHLSKEEQRKRFLARLENKQKNWKFSSSDVIERGFWDEYQHAYELALSHTSTKRAPWYVIPADNKPYAHVLIARILVATLQKMKPEFPVTDSKEELFMREAHEQLKAEEDPH